MTLVESLPKNIEGDIIFDPSGSLSDGEFFSGVVGVEWFKNTFPDLANAEVPLSNDEYNSLKGIDKCWEINAERWKKEEHL